MLQVSIHKTRPSIRVCEGCRRACCPECIAQESAFCVSCAAINEKFSRTKNPLSPQSQAVQNQPVITSQNENIENAVPLTLNSPELLTTKPAGASSSQPAGTYMAGSGSIRSTITIPQNTGSTIDIPLTPKRNAAVPITLCVVSLSLIIGLLARLYWPIGLLTFGDAVVFGYLIRAYYPRSQNTAIGAAVLAYATCALTWIVVFAYPHPTLHFVFPEKIVWAMFTLILIPNITYHIAMIEQVG